MRRIVRDFPMRCLYIVSHHPISPNYRGGGSAIYYEQLASIRALGHDVDLWHYAHPETRRSFDAFVSEDCATYDRVKAMCRSIHVTVLPEKVGFTDRVRARATDLFSGHRVTNPLYRTVALRELCRLIQQLGPDFIWAQHAGPGQVAALQRQVPVIYTHHDWLYKVKALSNGRQDVHRDRRQEELIATLAAAVVSGSATECEQLRAIGCRHVTYIPVAYDPVGRALPPAPTSPARLVHLGGLATTANRVGLERFFEIVWPALASPRPEFRVVGDLAGAPPHLLERLAEVTCTGFVSDPATVLHPYDLHIIAWEHDTGTRTRLPLVFSYGQVVVAVRASVAGLPEARDGENCRLVDHLSEMPAVLNELLHDPVQRERLGRAARATFEVSFTREALLPRYQSVIRAAAGRDETGGSPALTRTAH